MRMIIFRNSVSGIGIQHNRAELPAPEGGMLQLLMLWSMILIMHERSAVAPDCVP